MKIYSVEILSSVMGIWLIWIIIVYVLYFHNIKTMDGQKNKVMRNENTKEGARALRKQTYTIAVTFPSYFIFWLVVVIWGLSYITKN